MNTTNIDALVRPRTLNQLFKSASETSISKIVSSGFINHSFLLAGWTGCGKTTTARAMASYIFTGDTSIEYNLDDSTCYIEVNAAKYTGVDNMRQLIDEVVIPPFAESKIVLVLDEAHLLTAQAQSALQKPLEEPQEHLYIMLCTNEPQKLKKEIKNRCQLLNFNKPNTQTLIKYAREYAINNILDTMNSAMCTKLKSNIDALTDTKLTEIIDNTDMSFRSMIIKTYEFILTGSITGYIEEQPETLAKMYKLLIYPSKETWRFDLANVMKTASNFEDLRKALCNYIGAIYINTLTKSVLNDTIKYMTAIDILRKELSYSCQKADLAERLSKIILKNAGVIA